MSATEKQLLIGIHPVAAAINSAPERVSLLILAEESRNSRVQELAQQAENLGIQICKQARAAMDHRCKGERHQDVIAEFSADNIWSERDLEHLLAAIEGPPLVLVLDGVQDPHNLGACLRTAEAAGVGPRRRRLVRRRGVCH